MMIYYRNVNNESKMLCATVYNNTQHQQAKSKRLFYWWFVQPRINFINMPREPYGHMSACCVGGNLCVNKTKQKSQRRILGKNMTNDWFYLRNTKSEQLTCGIKDTAVSVRVQRMMLIYKWKCFLTWIISPLLSLLFFPPLQHGTQRQRRQI